MAIEITGHPGNSNIQQSTSQSAGVSAERNQPAPVREDTGRSSTADTVSLTDTAAKLQSLERSLDKLPVVDSERVSELRQAIADGSYEVNSARVADKLLNLERSLSD